MNREKAVEILNLKNQRLTEGIIRKAYLKASLKYHPDKYRDNGDKFKEVASAYRYLCENNKLYPEETPSNFDKIFDEFISLFSHERKWDNIFVRTTLKGIYTKCDSYILRVFDRLEKDTAIALYDFLVCIDFFTHMENKFLDNIKEIIKKKMKFDNIIILNPSIQDLLNDNIYKLELPNNEFYIPLWHNELYFELNSDNNKHDLIVRMEPELSNNIHIDHNNNISVFFKKSIKEIFGTETISIHLGDKTFNIECAKIMCSKKKQIFHFKNKGILKMNSNNIFDSTRRGDVNIELELF